MVSMVFKMPIAAIARSSALSSAFAVSKLANVSAYNKHHHCRDCNKCFRFYHYTYTETYFHCIVNAYQVTRYVHCKWDDLLNICTNKLLQHSCQIIILCLPDQRQ